MNRMIKRLLAAVLITSMLLGSNGISYAAEIADGDSIAGTEEVTKEAVDEEQVESPGDAEASEPASEESAEEEQIQEEAGEGQEADAQTVEEAGAEASEEENTAAEEEISEAASEEEAVEPEDEDAAVTEEAAAAEDAEAPENADAAAAELTAEEAAAAAAAAQEEVFTAGELVYHGHDYDVTLAYDENAKIPAAAELKVREIEKGTSEYESYLAGAEAAAGKGVAEARFFDITIVAAGTDGQQQEIQPQSQVRVNITYHKALEVAAEGEVQAMHFEDGTADAEVVNTDTNGGSEVSEIAFDAESFSVYGIVYTVDFTYDGFTYSMPGEGSIYLSELAELLGLYETDLDKAFSIGNVSNVTFTNYDLVKIERQADGDWLLTSLASFTSEETLTVTMVDGTKFVVMVTDPPEETQSGEIDITSTLESVKILVDGQEVDADGQIDLVADTVYEIRLAFRETDDCQFSNNDTEMYYDLPDNVSFLESGGTFTMNLGSLGSLEGNTYTIIDGRVYVKFNTNDTEHMDILRMASEAHFSFKIQGFFDLNEHIINWNDRIETEVTVEEKHDAKVKKTGSYNENTDKIEYLVTVDSEGTTSGITITDTLTGTALVSDVNSVDDITVTLTKADGSTSEITPTDFNKSGNTFVLNLPDMEDGDHYDIRYTASVDYEKLSKSGNASYSESVNGVELSWNESDEPDTDESYGYNIDYGSFSKEATDVGDVIEDETGKYRLITYTIKSNEKMKKAVSQITDTIRTDSQSIMKMYGDGLNVVVTKPDGTTQTRTLAWGEGGLTKTSDYSWVYNPPAAEDGAAMYEITYQTRVDMSGVNTTVNVNNDAHDDNDSDGDSQGITPGEGDEVELSKTVASENEEEVKWSIDLTVPRGGLGLDSATVTDTVPKLGSLNVYDIVKSVEVTGINPEESYTISYRFLPVKEIQDNGYWQYGEAYTAESPRSDDDVISEVYITFYKDAAKTQKGLNGGLTDRLINVTIVTENNEIWMEYARNSDGWVTEQGHKNYASIGSITRDATAHPSSKNIAKYKDPNNPYKVTVDGVEYSAYKYWVRLDGVNSDTNEIVDTFDKEVFELLKVNTPDDNGKIYFSDYLWNQQSTENTYAQLTDTSSGGLIRTTSLPKKSDGSYYKYYKIEYYLVMKDLNKALEKAEAVGGVVKFKNTAGYENAKSEVEIEFGHKIVDKEAVIDGDKVTFTITINPDKLKLNNGADMILRDTFSKTLSINYSSVSITADPEENESKVTYDYYGNTGEFKIPDETKVVITYVSKVIGTGNVNIWNNAVLNGKYDDGFDEWVQISSEGEGGADVYAIYLLKYQSENMQEGALAGAKFRVLDSELNPIKYSNKLDPESGNSDEIGKDITFTTSAGGMILIGLSRYAHGVNLKKDTVYYLEEIEAPENMQLDATLYSFVISDDPNHANYTREDGVWVYYVGDILKIRNYPEDQNLVLTKRFAGNIALTEDQKKKISFEIVKVDENGTEITGDEAFKKTVNYKDMSSDKYTVTSETVDDEGRTTFGTGYYKVTEKNASAATLGLKTNVVAETTYSVSSNGTTKTDEAVVTTDAVTGQNLANVSSSESTSVIFTNTYTTGAYYFNKVDAGTDQPLSGAVFTVKKADDDSEVTHYTTGTDGKFSIKRAGDDFSTLNENVLYYVVETTAPENYIIPDPAPKYYFYFGTEGAEAPAGAAENNAINLGEQSATETVVNASETAITVFKDWKNSDGSSISDSELQGLQASITLKRKSVKDGEESEDATFAENATLNYQNDFTKVWNNLPKTDEEGAVYKYYVVEQPISDFSVTYENNDGIESGTITVVNTKTEEKGYLKVKKTVSGAVLEEAKTFKFTVKGPDNKYYYLENGATKASDTEVYVEVVVAAGQTTGESGVLSVPLGSYTVTEVKGEDNAEIAIEGYTVKSVTDPGEVAVANTTTETSPAEATATNTYEEEKGYLKVKKTVSGAVLEEAKTFKFTVKGPDNKYYYLENGATKASDTEVYVEVVVAAGQTTGESGVLSVPLGSYTVTEVKGEDNAEIAIEGYTVKSVTDPGEVAVANTTTETSPAEASATNTYEEEKGYLKVKKTVSGAVLEEAKTFKFTVKGPDNKYYYLENGATKASDTEVYVEVVVAAGQTTGESGVLSVPLGSYTVTEVKGEDNAEIAIEGYTVKSVTDPGEVTVAKTNTSENPAEASATNTYVKNAEEEIKVKKVLVGRPWKSDDSFTFTLEGVSGAPMPAGSTDGKKEVTVTTSEVASFGAISYTESGTYTYTITETDPKLAGITCDTAPHTVTVKVELKENKLTAVVTYDNGADAQVTDAQLITNTYAANGEIVLKARKELSGKELEADKFSFVLKDAGGKPLQTKPNEADGSVTFDAIKYTQDDIYKYDAESGEYKLKDKTSYEYKIQEVIPDDAVNADGTAYKDASEAVKKAGGFKKDGYTYDGTEHTITVELTDKGDGTINAKVAGSGDDAGDTGVVVTNAYDADGTLKLDAEKTFKNGTLKGGEFTFELMDKDGKVLQSKKNDAAGNVSFDMITYKLADAAKAPFTYTVREVPGSRADVKYDATVYTVTVELKDKGDGTLEVTKKIDNGGALKFENEQLNVETSVMIGGVKQLKGGTLKKDQFKFVLADENGKWLDTATNDAEGNFTFKPITYKLSDLNGEKTKVYSYSVWEVKGSESGITYDKTVYTVKVTVTDNGDGTMTAKADKAKSDIKFVNTTTEKKSKKTSSSKSSKTGDEAPLGVLFGGLGVGAIGLAVLLWNRKKKKDEE